MNTVNAIHGDSGNTRWGTPTIIIEAARALFGGVIDLDPASSDVANARVKAERYFSIEDDGLTRPWRGNVFMNHPYGRKNNPLWINKAVQEYNSGYVTQLIAVTWASTSEAWFQPLTSFPMAFVRGRMGFYPLSGQKTSGASKGMAITYMGNRVHRFGELFGEFSSVFVPYKAWEHL